MSDLSQTAASVKITAGSRIVVGTAGETVTQGQPATLINGKWQRGRATTAPLANCTGIFITPAVLDGPVVVALAGCEINLGATLAIGEVYVVSATLGAIAPIGDLVATNFVTTLGVAKSTSVLILNPQPSATAKA
jgi:hypothetical protein